MFVSEIAEGASFLGIKTDKFKTNRISFTMNTPLSGNISAKAVLIYYLSRRCAQYPSFSSFSRALEQLYGAAVSPIIEKHGESLILGLGISSIDDRFALEGESISAKCLELLIKMIFEPLLTGESFDRDMIAEDKRLVKERIEAQKSDKRVYAFNRLVEIMFADEAYGKNKLGTVEGIDELTAADVYAEWKHLLKSAKIQVVSVGSGDPEKICAALVESFPQINREVVSPSTEFLPGLPKINYVCETMPVKQGKLVMGFRTGMRNSNDNREAMRIAVDIFGGGTYSKLFSVVREKMSLCYYCSAGFYSEKGVVIVQSGIENENEEKSKAEIIRQLNEVALGNFTQDDFNASIKSFSDGLLSYNDTPEALASWYVTHLIRNELISPEQYVEKIKVVDTMQVITAAKTIMLDTVYMLKGDAQ